MEYTVRKDFPKALPSTKTWYCWHCGYPGAYKTSEKKIRYKCDNCGKSTSRVRIYDPKMAQYFDAQNRLVHESCGIFIFNPNNELLLFKRTKFPYLLTIPAGHLEAGEDYLQAAIRETQEEVGFSPANPKLLFEGLIEGDSCVGGADIHAWHAFICRTTQEVDIKLNSEGLEWSWYKFSDLNARNTVQPVLHILKQGL